jgi:molybdate transport system ATP-binding protein
MGEGAALTGGARLRASISAAFASGFVLDAVLDAPIDAGSVLVLFGPSGAGKTTLLRHIAGLERGAKERVEYGGEVWSDSSTGAWTPPQRRRVGVVFQEPTLFPHLSVRGNVEYGLPPDDRARRSLEAGAVLGIAPLFDRRPAGLSGGEARRVALARALAPSPRLLLLDEPFAALDAPTRSRLRQEVRALLRRIGTPAVLVTHDRTEAMTMGDRMAVLIDGRVRQVGAIGEVFGRPADAEVAAAVGVEAVIPASIVGSDGALLTVKIGSAVLSVAERPPEHQEEGEVYACIRAEDVTLELHSPSQASARNHLPAFIVAIAPEGPVDRVTLDCGFTLDALITHRSREEMRLAPGGTVTAAIKATSIHLVPRV